MEAILSFLHAGSRATRLTQLQVPLPVEPSFHLMFNLLTSMFIQYFCLLCIHMHACVCMSVQREHQCATTQAWRSEDSLWCILSFHHEGPEYRTQVFRLGRKCLCLLRHLAGPLNCILSVSSGCLHNKLLSSLYNSIWNYVWQFPMQKVMKQDR